MHPVYESGEPQRDLPYDAWVVFPATPGRTIDPRPGRATAAEAAGGECTCQRDCSRDHENE